VYVTALSIHIVTAGYCRPLTFDPSPPTEEGEDIHLAAVDDQAELMQWHYRLGHLTFAKLKQLALNGEISKKAGCLFGAMTKIPWRGKETKASHEVFIATKPEECVSVDQMTSTEVGFFAQMKGKLTKRRYRCATIFVRMAESIAQGLHHVAHESITGETDEDLFHDSHLELQEHMRNPIAFHAKMMGDIMYLNQALQQSDAKEFVQASVKEVNGHVDCNN
jgi:hypothetical protein